MKLRFVRSIFSTALVTVLASVGWGQVPAPAIAASAFGLFGTQDQGTDNGKEFHWTGKLSPDQVVVIKNINGDIDASGSSSTDQVEISAVKSGNGAEEVKIQVVKLNDGVMICTIYPGFFSSGGDCDSGHLGNNHNNATACTPSPWAVTWRPTP
jgi:hypothetical protein